MEWKKLFSDSEQEEIEFCLAHAESLDPNHEDFYNARLITKMTKLLNRVETALTGNDYDEELAPLARKALGITD